MYYNDCYNTPAFECYSKCREWDREIQMVLLIEYDGDVKTTIMRWDRIRDG